MTFKHLDLIQVFIFCATVLAVIAKVNNKWRITFYTGQINWNSGAKFCEDNGGRMIRMDSVRQNVIKSFSETVWMDDWSNDFWIGLYRRHGIYMWQCNVLADLSTWSNWDSGPDDSKLCTKATGDYYEWVPYDCSNEFQLVCEYDIGSCTYTDITPADADGICVYGMNHNPQINMTIDACRELCHTWTINGEDCWAITFDPVSNRCFGSFGVNPLLYKTTDSCQGVSFTGKHMYYRNCFEATKSSSLPPSDSETDFPVQCDWSTTTETPTTETTTETPTTETPTTEIPTTETTTNETPTTETTTTETPTTETPPIETTTTETQTTETLTTETTTETPTTETPTTETTTTETQTAEIPTTETPTTETITETPTTETTTTETTTTSASVVSTEKVTIEIISSTQEMLTSSTRSEPITSSNDNVYSSISTVQSSNDMSTSDNDVTTGTSGVTSSDVTQATTEDAAQQNNITHIPTNVKSICFCTCQNSTMTLDEKLDKIINFLKINKYSTSKAKMKLKSADDDRPSAKTIGLIGVAILSIIFGLLIIPDFIGILCFFERP